MTQVRVGWRAYVSPVGGGTGTDTDAQAFITAAAITDSVQVSALNTLVTDLKTYGLWTKIKALYPFVGGSAASHKWNLKDPRDLNVAFRLTFNGGGIHNATGYQPNGTNGSANTFLAPSANQTLTSSHFSLYSRTSDKSLSIYGSHGIYNSSSNCSYMIIRRNLDNYVGGAMWSESNGGGAAIIASTPDGRGLYMISRTSNNSLNFYKNRTSIISNTLTQSSTLPTNSYWLGGNNGSAYGDYDNKELAFASIGDGLTDTDAANLFTSVQKFQTTLGRHVGTPYVSDPDAIAFLMAAGITDGTQAAAINTLVIRMKADGVWTKMKAIYPFIGGTATSHKFNLKDPRDLDAAFRLVFSGGWTHSSTGALPNGTTGYADTKLVPSSTLSLNSTHILYYSRTNISTMGSDFGTIGSYTYTNNLYGYIKYNDGKTYFRINRGGTLESSIDIPDSRLFYMMNRTSSSQEILFTNTTKNTFNYNSTGLSPFPVFLGASNKFGTGAFEYSSRESAFATIGDGLTDTEALAFYNSIQAYQTTLGRQVNVPIVSDTDAQAFLNAANITSFQQASAVNKLVVDLKAAGVWSKMKAIYPFVGGSATSHKFNLKDPRDLNVAYRLVFNGGWTHTSTGAKPNGSNGYADTFVVPKNVFNATTFNHVSYYSRTNSTLTTPPYRYDLGVDDYNSSGVYYGGLSMIIKRDTNMTAFGTDYGLQSSYRWTYTTTSDSLGLFIGSQTGVNVKLYKNNSVLSSNTEVASSSYNILNPSATRSIWIGTMNELNYTAHNRWSDKESAFISIGEGLNDTEATSLYTAVQAYQTSLGRQLTTPIYNNGLVLNLDAGNANSYPGTGTTWFDLASGNNGTLTNGPTYDTANGGSLLFDGVNDYVGLGNIPIFGTSSFTIDMWIYLPISDYNYRAILSKRSNSNYTGFAVYRPPYSNSVAIQLASNSSGPYFTTSISSTANSWNHISIIVNRTSKTVILYSNGIKNTSTLDITNLDDITNNGVNLNIGLEAGIPNWNNKISTTKIYSRVLTETEILNNFNSTRGRFGL